MMKAEGFAMLVYGVICLWLVFILFVLLQVASDEGAKMHNEQQQIETE